MTRGKLIQQFTDIRNQIRSLEASSKMLISQNMHLLSEFQIGDELVDVSSMRSAKVTELYRTHDESLIVYCRLDNGDNFSRYGYSLFAHPYVSKRDAEQRNDVFINKIKEFSRRIW